ncbi:DcaP family trimeric outer membrane transporter [Tateyamaria sp. SN6-1]|uniref:DcaP family trimeric outer membrane transporter n=1 Tax=Tateyamaria sp. SN6-1 TaxID=3092148 RepID=UPI0039F55038
MRHKFIQAAAALGGLLATTALAQAQTATEDELRDLRQRIDTLEAQQAALETKQEAQEEDILSGFRINGVESLGDPDQIGQRNGLGRLSFGAGQATTITLYGFVRAEAFYDTDFSFGDLTRAGRVGDTAFATDGEFDTSVRVSRFGIRSRTDTDIGKIETQLEFDLFGGSDEEGSSPTLRLRHANVEFNDTLLIGQFWSNFQPLVHYPTSADFNGPVGIAFARVPQIRYTYNGGNGFQASASIEESNGGNSGDPVLTAAAFYETDAFSVRAAALTGTFRDGAQEFDTNGVTLSGQIKPWQGGTISATYVTGEALGNLLIGGGARQVGGQENDSDGFTVEYRQDIGEKWNVGIAYGNESYDLGTAVGATGNAFTDLDSIHINAFYTPVENLTIGVEYIQIQSEGPGGFSAEGDRIGASVTFRF